MISVASKHVKIRSLLIVMRFSTRSQL